MLPIHIPSPSVLRLTLSFFLCFPGEAAKEDEWAREAQGAVVGFFTPQRCVRLCDLLLQHLMGTRPDDVDLWLSSPEELILDEEQVRTLQLASDGWIG
jgi:hypothetical protein